MSKKGIPVGATAIYQKMQREFAKLERKYPHKTKQLQSNQSNG
jgi:hypothetical protein